MRVRVGEGPVWGNNRHLPGEEAWLVGEWRSSGERKYYLSNLPPRTSLRGLVRAMKARWVCEQAHQQLKVELGLGRFEGRSWTGLHRHALMSLIAFCFLQHLWLKARGKSEAEAEPSPGPPPRPTLPTIRRRLLASFSLALTRCPCCGADLCPSLPAEPPT